MGAFCFRKSIWVKASTIDFGSPSPLPSPPSGRGEKRWPAVGDFCLLSRPIGWRWGGIAFHAVIASVARQSRLLLLKGWDCFVLFRSSQWQSLLQRGAPLTPAHSPIGERGNKKVLKDWTSDLIPFVSIFLSPSPGGED